ncbi:DUF2637 domain-containing protein [Streptomyces lavendulae]|uniref:DUF2637 domain-containing protein n=1 Tax=Streptomyces lavendulae TaxID=1914 RepID=UPI00371D196D
MACAAFALSYDALRQMAAASHIHPILTYAFPLVIDGFIAIGIGALLILRTAPLRARLYVSALVGLATLTSIWANVLHAIRLNQQARHGGLLLDDITVGTISAIAPLALAGAVHLYLLVHRQPDARHNTAGAHATACPKTATRLEPAQATADSDAPAPTAPKPGRVVAAPDRKQVAEIDGPPKRKGRKPSATLEQAIEIGRTTQPGRDGHASRRRIEAAVRDRGFTINKDLAEQAKDLLQAELDEHAAAVR